MSIKALPKQLPSEHILERRFSPYKKASNYIRHLERHFSYKNQIELLKYPMSAYTKSREKLPQTEKSKKCLSPVGQLSHELQQKIELLNNYNNLSEIQPKKKRTKRIKSHQLKTVTKFEIKIEKKNYAQLINKVFYEKKEKTIDLLKKLSANQEISKIRKSTLSQKNLNFDIPDKNDNNQDSNRMPYFTLIDSKSPQSIYDSRTEKKIPRCLSSQKNGERRRKESPEHEEDKSRHTTPKHYEEIENLLMISPITKLQVRMGLF